MGGGSVSELAARRLTTLAEEINSHHHAVEQAVNTALTHAFAAGELLAEVKSELPHGSFGAWLKENFNGSDRTARAYMRVARHREELESKTADSADLSLDGALKELATPSDKPYCTTMIPNSAGGWDEKHYYTIQEYAAANGYRVSPPLLIDAEFNGLLPPLADDEYAGLERNILEWGCTDAIVAWNNTILDGHARYEICVKHGIDYLVCDVEMESRNDAAIYILETQLGRTNLSPVEKMYMRTKHEVGKRESLQR